MSKKGKNSRDFCLLCAKKTTFQQKSVFFRDLISHGTLIEDWWETLYVILKRLRVPFVVLLCTCGNRRSICKQAEDIMMRHLITREEIT